jgi:hypothetical protein
MNLTPVGIDIAKTVFQVHYINQDTGEVVNKPIRRAAFLEHFANLAPCLIGMEACGGRDPCQVSSAFAKSIRPPLIDSTTSRRK